MAFGAHRRTRSIIRCADGARFRLCAIEGWKKQARDAFDVLRALFLFVR